MSNFDYEILEADKPDNVTLEQAQQSIAAEYPDHHVIVEDHGDTFVATLARKSKVSRTVVAADDDALDLLDDAPPVPGKKDEDEEAPKKDEGEEKPKEEKKDDDEKGGGDPVSQVLEALNTLEKHLPKIKEQLGGGDVVDVPIPDEALGPMPPVDGPPGGPVGPTPGAPPAAAGRPPVPKSKPDMRKKPSVGVPTFSKRKNKVVFRPVANEDGTEVSLAEATAEITSHPKYAGYDVMEVKREGDEYKAHLRFREE